jgi:hypothetical protein
MLVQVGVVLAVATAAVAVGYGPTQARWGVGGVNAMWTATVICLVGALLAAAVLGVVISRWPSYAPQAVFGGTAIRLLVTGALAFGCLLALDVHLTAFLVWLLALYLLLLAVETALSIVLVRRLTGDAVGSKG